MDDLPSGSISYAVSPVAVRVLLNLRAGEGVASPVPELGIVLRKLARHTDTTAYDRRPSSIECPRGANP
jgi:hypothetical protein